MSSDLSEGAQVMNIGALLAEYKPVCSEPDPDYQTPEMSE